MLNILGAMVMATEDYWAGEGAAAVALLRRVAAAAADYEDSANNGSGDVDIQFDIDLLNLMADVMLANNATEPTSDDIPEDPWPAD